jgi:hypothetical protein
MSKKDLEDVQRGALFGAPGSFRRKWAKKLGEYPPETPALTKEERTAARLKTLKEYMAAPKREPQQMLPSTLQPFPSIKENQMEPIVEMPVEESGAAVNEKEDQRLRQILQNQPKTPVEEQTTFSATEPGTDPLDLVDKDMDGLPSDDEIRRKVLMKMRRGY